MKEGGAPFVMPDLSTARGLVAPVLDLLTFYSDLFLAINVGNLREAGDRVHVPNPTAASWADGTSVLVGEDAVDFEIQLRALDRTAGVATLAVGHVPPAQSRIRILADWMRPPVGSTPNNWVQVTRSGDAYVASLGQETFDVVLRLRLTDGAVLSASMENPVVTIERRCRDLALQQCDEAHPGRVLRRIEMTLEP